MSVRIIIGDALDELRRLPEASVQCCVCSPPYFNHRDYGIAGQIGLEDTPDEYVARLVAVFREVRRVLRDDGVLWLNIGDSYASDPRKGRATAEQSGKAGYLGGQPNQCRFAGGGIKPKDLIGIPWMTAFALRADGWWLRGDHVWGKPNGMPENVMDRPTHGHEYVFLLSRSERYRYDAAAVRTAPKASTETRLAQDIGRQTGSARANGGAKTNGPMRAVARASDKKRGHSRQMAKGVNLRSVWWVPPAQFREAHFAVMPDLVAEICIRAGCPEGGSVLDPFAGAGTTGLVADRLGRDAILIEINPSYAAMARRRIEGDAPMLARVDMKNEART